MKRILIVLTVIILCVCMVFAAFACKDKTPAETKPAGEQNGTPDQSAEVTPISAVTLAEANAAQVSDVPTIADCTVGEGFDIGTVRFAFYSPETGWTEDVANAPFDESKPTVIHSHGQGADGYMFTPDALYDEGFNVISFLWGTLSDDMDVLRIELRIWQLIEDYVDYGDNGNVREAAGFNCTVPEIFAARYCDFFALHPDYNLPIRLTGHSYGGQLTFALSTYFTKLFLSHRLPARLLPERYTLLDPYFDNYAQDFDCRWLGVKVPYSSVGMALYCLENVITPNNVAIEMLRTSNLVELACIMGIDDDNSPDYFTQMKPLFRVVELANKNELRNQFSSSITGSGFLHTIANDFYFSPNARTLYADADGVAIFGRANSASLVLATRGMRFDFNVDQEDYRRYENVTVWRTQHEAVEEMSAEEFDAYTVVSGIVARDANANGTMDEKAAERLTGVTVILKDQADGSVQTATTASGFYSFRVKRGATYTLTLKAENYQEKTATVTASSFVNLADFALAKKG